MDHPSLRYYESLVGDWSGTMQMRVSDPEALGHATPLVRLMGLFARLDGHVTMATTLRRAPDTAAGPSFDHTTTVSRLGITALRSVERMVLAADGTTASMCGVHRVPPRSDEPYEGTVTIGDDAQTAVYRFTWMHAPMVQRTQIVAGGLRLTQETSWSRHEALLVQASLPCDQDRTSRAR